MYFPESDVILLWVQRMPLCIVIITFPKSLEDIVSRKESNDGVNCFSIYLVELC